MLKPKNFFSHWNLQIRPTCLLAKVVVTSAIVVCTVTLIALHITLWNAKNELGELNQQAAEVQRQNQLLTEKVEGLGSVDSYLQIAAQELGLIDPDTIIIESK